MSKIRILPEQLANQIAAGEVIERPASVIKELLENSLDAGASHIEIEVEGGGTRLLRVIDNGEGMDEDDLLLSLERHGTSKIQEAEDLQAINTLGFRGEAIPSIGSVSNMTICSRTGDADLGTEVTLKYGKLQKVHETGCAKGTIVEIKNLFGNTPARRKFLRTVRTEIGHIEETIKNYALATPDVSFILRVNGRETIHFDKSVTLENRLKTIMHYKGELMEIKKEDHQNQYGVHGFLVPPDQPVSGAARLRFLVNGRAIRDRMLTHAVNEGLRGFLMKGKFPAGLLCVSLPAGETDVNVHPAKHEIRFRNSREVHHLVTTSIRNTLLDHQNRVRADLFGTQSTSSSSPIPLEENIPEPVWVKDTEQPDIFSPPSPSADNAYPPATQLTEKPATVDKLTGPPSSYESEQNPQTTNKPAIDEKPLQTTSSQMTPIAAEQQRTYTSPPAVKKTPVSDGFRIIGQLKNLYLLCENEHGLFVIDQHAAHERLLYEELRSQYLSDSIVSQTLLFPETVELSIFQTQLVEKNLPSLEKMGFSIRDFGGNSFVISAIPALAGQTNPTALFLDILEQFGSEKSTVNEGANRLNDILADIACKAAIKAGHDLKPIEMEALLDRMVKADLFSHCPHGRPVFKQFTQNDIKKWFHRT